MYKYDPYGTLQDNLVTERFNISSLDSNRKVWVPHAAPFFTKDLEIKNIITGELLIYKKDYVFSDDMSVNRRVVESNIYNTVVFLGDVLGMFEGTYRTMGGGLVYATRNYFVDLASALLEPAHVLYSHVTNVPTVFPPDHHLHSWSDYRNKHYIANTINGINAAIRAGEVTATTDLAPLADELTALGSYLDTLNLDSHTQEINAHSVSAADIGALPIGATATSALRAYGATLDQLVTYVKDRQSEGVDLSSFIRKDGGSELVKSIVTKLIKTPNDESSVTTVNKNLVYKTLGSVDLWANISGSGVATLQAGKNTLTVDAAPYAQDASTLKLNGIPVCTSKTITYQLKVLNLTERTLVVKNNELAFIGGDGSSQVPLSVNVVLQPASDTTAGVAKLTRAWGTSASLVMESDLIKALSTNLTGYVPRERTINGRSITADINIPASEIGLGLADNTSDLNKPLSTAQSNLLATYSVKGHVHAYTAPIATASIQGIARLFDTWTGSEVGVFTPNVLTKYQDRLVLAKGYKKTYAGEPMLHNALYAVIRDKPMLRRGSEFQLLMGEDYLVIR